MRQELGRLSAAVTSYEANAAAVRTCLREYSAALQRCPAWAMARIRAKLAHGHFDLDQELPTKVKLSVICQDKGEIQSFLRFLNGSWGANDNSPAGHVFFPALGISIVEEGCSAPELPTEFPSKAAPPLVVMLISESAVQVHLTQTIEVLLRPDSVFLAMRSALAAQIERSKDKNDTTEELRFNILHRRYEKYEGNLRDAGFEAYLFGSSRQDLTEEFQKELHNYIERRLETRVSDVALRLMAVAKDVIYEVIMTPMVRQQIKRKVLHGLRNILRNDHHELAKGINDLLEEVRAEIGPELARGFRYPPEVLDDLRVWELGNRWQLSGTERPECAVQRCIELIRDFTSDFLCAKLSEFLSKDALKKYTSKPEQWEALRDELITNIRSKLKELGLLAAPFYQEKQILKQLIDLEGEVLRIYSQLTSSSLLKDLNDEMLIGNFLRSAMREVNYNFGTFHAEFLKEEQWIAQTASKFLTNAIRANLGHFACQNLLTRLEESCAEAGRTEEEEDSFDFSPLAKSMQTVFLKAFVICRSREKKDSASTIFVTPRHLASGVAMRTETLLSLQHCSLQPLLGIHMILGDPCSIRVFSPVSHEQLFTGRTVIAMTLLERVRLMLDVVYGLRFLHTEGITHGGLTLEAVLIKEGPRAVLSSPVPCTDPIRLRRMVLFKAPELRQETVFVGDLPVDVFAAGVLLWFLVRGHCKDAPPRDDAWNLPIPDSPMGADQLWRLFRVCCAQRARDRPTVANLEEELEKEARSISLNR